MSPRTLRPVAIAAADMERAVQPPDNQAGRTDMSGCQGHDVSHRRIADEDLSHKGDDSWQEVTGQHEAVEARMKLLEYSSISVCHIHVSRVHWDKWLEISLERIGG